MSATTQVHSPGPDIARHAASPLALVMVPFRHRALIARLSSREIAEKFKSSLLGPLWLVLTPILMLAVYSFVFTVVFAARWGSGIDDREMNFVLMLYIGLILHTLLSECISTAPSMVLRNQTYVKKVVFPLEILPFVQFYASLFVLGMSLLIWIGYCAYSGEPFAWTMLLLPVVIAPLGLVCLAAMWTFAALGVYLRDINQLTGVLNTCLLFLSPIFFPLALLPEGLQDLVYLNPLTVVVEQARTVLLIHNMPDWEVLGVYTLVAALLAWLGFAWFQRIRKGFADVM